MAAPNEGLAEVRPLRGGGDLTEAARHVLAALPDLVPTMGAAYRREVAEYAALDEATFDHVLRTSEAFVRRFVADLADGIAQPVPEHGALVAAGRRRQQAGISLDAAMHAFRIASREGWTGIADAVTEAAPQLVSALAGRWIEYVDRASTAFAEGHTSASTEQLRRLDARRHALLADLLAAEDEVAARAVAAGHGARVAGRYLPVLLEGRSAPAVDAVATRLPSDALVGPRGGHLLVLLAAEDLDEPDARLLADLGSDLVVHGRPTPLGAALRHHLTDLEALVTTAIALGRDGVLGPDDLALHRAVREHDALGRRLRDRVLAPLVDADPDGVFRETLRAYLEDGAIRSVADRLFVHANTVTYRLRRVRELTGLDARVPQQAAELVLACALEDATADQTTDARTEPR